MKNCIACLLLLGSPLILPAQNQAYRNSLSLNFSGAFTDLRKEYEAVQPLLLLVPSIEYRFHLLEDWSLRASIRFSPRQSWNLRDTQAKSFFENDVSQIEAGLSAGIQYRIWGEDYIPQFWPYVFGELGVDWLDGQYNTFRESTLTTTRSDSRIWSFSTSIGAGFVFFPGNRWIFTIETMGLASLNFRDIRIEVFEGLPARFTSANESQFRYTSFRWVPAGEFSIGWRF